MHDDDRHREMALPAKQILKKKISKKHLQKNESPPRTGNTRSSPSTVQEKWKKRAKSQKARKKLKRAATPFVFNCSRGHNLICQAMGFFCLLSSLFFLFNGYLPHCSAERINIYCPDGESGSCATFKRG